MAGRDASPPPWHSGPKVWSKIKPSTKLLRREPTPAEEVLWEKLRNGRLGGHRFRRQHAIGQFVVDFLCWKARLVVEIDGGIHASQAIQDQARQSFIENCGLRVLRFSNDQVFKDTDSVLAAIDDFLYPSPSPTGEGVG